MQFSAADQAAMIAAIGEDVSIAGVTFKADVRVQGQLVTLFDGSVENTGPLVRVTAADYVAYGIGHGTEIVVRGATSSVIETMQEASGFWLLRISSS